MLFCEQFDSRPALGRRACEELLLLMRAVVCRSPAA